ncbi:MAG TPA: DUF5017 domain-containing protein [Chitinophagaceae bacterium]|jgi:hypothetical protein|nr:DUF5017 domain-containing protein [Chitinophagaceae bacterium]HMU57254.1 DUF5017 domain-containing protein [Chitinophagaceae bacterium]
MYNKRFLIITVLAGVFFSSCSKDLKLKSLSFDATVNKATMATTDTAVFTFSGNPDYITFYSGEPGKKYEFRNRTTDTSTNVQLNFSTATTTHTSGTLSLMVSDNFNGKFDSANVRSATWTDITSRATLATGTTVVASGTISLADFAAAKKPVYIAFKYAAAAGATQKKWTITGLTLKHVLTDKTYTIGDMTATTPSMGWMSADVQNSAVNWTSALVITGNTTAASAVATEDWMIMGPVDLSRVLPDAGTAIKSVNEGMNKFPYAYKYAAAGTYNAVFVASNANRDAQETASKTIAITVQ